MKSRLRTPPHLDPPKVRARVTVPNAGHPHAKLVFAEMRRQGRTYDWLQDRSGVLRATFKAWRHKNRPGLESLEATLNALGYQYVPVPVLEVLPPDIARDLAALAERMNAEMPVTFGALIAIAAEQRERLAKVKAA
ncbi:hypothetical protein GJ689_10475 [Rhodoplanes serenus]|uniref:Uncharacterized protein n=1 Tax=Rhodoplanes serenus TaxID=200615 RepID=A0A9X4XM05_9BRAD|nr:hypothetical protein [Rhodoplanes serenus]MTW16629.1 hypothetical protein [Rhodoplanes serenus]